MRERASNRESASDSYRIGSPDCPKEFSDAGDAENYKRMEQERHIRKYRVAARKSFEHAQRTYRHAHDLAEESARKALTAGARAYWLAENTDLADLEYRRLYKMGAWTRRTFGCHLTFESGRYSQRCPVAIASKRFGFSPGFTAVRWCSICDQDLSECAHLKDRLYWVRGGPRGPLPCAVCIGVDDRCTHRQDRLYRAPVVGVIKKIDEFREVSIVNDPAQPFARLIELPIEIRDLREHLGANFIAGTPVSCDRCLGPYPGLPPHVDLDSDATPAENSRNGLNPQSTE